MFGGQVCVRDGAIHPHVGGRGALAIADAARVVRAVSSRAGLGVGVSSRKRSSRSNIATAYRLPAHAGIPLVGLLRLGLRRRRVADLRTARGRVFLGQLTVFLLGGLFAVRIGRIR